MDKYRNTLILIAIFLIALSVGMGLSLSGDGLYAPYLGVLMLVGTALVGVTLHKWKDATKKLNSEIQEKTMWVNPHERIPETGKPVLCKVRHFHTKNIQEHELVKVDESDCDWRTSDDNSELSYDWTVIEWKDDDL